jgi:hypothetical protein
VREALDLLEPHIRPAWLVPQYRHALDGHGDRGYDREGQQQVLRPTFEGIRDSVRELIGKQMDALARQFAATHEMKVKNFLNDWLRSMASSKSRGGSCRSEGWASAQKKLNQAPAHELALEIGVINRGCDEARDAEGRLHDKHGQQ